MQQWMYNNMMRPLLNVQLRSLLIHTLLRRFSKRGMVPRRGDQWEFTLFRELAILRSLGRSPGYTHCASGLARVTVPSDKVKRRK